MKTVAPHDRPREKLQRVGAGALGDNELLAIVLGHGRASASALDLANAVLARAGGAARSRPGALRRAVARLRESVRRARRRSSRRWSSAGER